MKSKIFFCLILSLIVCSLNSISFSQDQKINPGNTPVTLKPDLERSIENNTVVLDPEVERLQDQLLEYKKAGNINRVLDIQKELDKLTGSVSMKGEDFLLTEIKSNQLSNDNINNALVSQVTGVKGISTCTEQIGSTAGRIWSAFVFGPNSGATIDQLRLCYKNFGDNSWTEYVTLGFSSANRMWQDQIDAELIENTSGDKFLYVAFGYATNNYVGVYRIGVTIIKITGGLSFSGYTLNWPGTVNSNYYQRPRIVSDNEAYRSNPWIYISCVLDSAVSGGYRSGEKVAIVYSPYTVAPTFTYKPTSFIGLAFNYPSDFHCDIAYFRNGGNDSIMLVESSLGDSSRIAIAKASISSYVSSSTFIGSFNVTVARRYQAYIATNGAFAPIMIVNMRKYSETDWDIEYFLSTAGSIGWSTGYMDYRGANSRRADIQGFRSAPGVFACAYVGDINSSFPVSYCASTNYTWGGISDQMNHTNTNPYTAQPRPGVSYGPENENCFALWTEYSGSTNVWSSTGCFGTIGVLRNIFFRGVIEGFWTEPYMVPDTARLYLRQSSSPYNIVDSSKSVLDNDGYGNFWFTNSNASTNYYVEFNHRNTLETWSSSTIQFAPVSVSYDFTTAASKAYGNNIVQVPNFPDALFAFYSGDINQDGVIEGTDLLMIDNDATNFVSGYVPTDTNGDNFVDGSDALITDNNAANFVSVIRP